MLEVQICTVFSLKMHHINEIDNKFLINQKSKNHFRTKLFKKDYLAPCVQGIERKSNNKRSFSFKTL